MYDRHFVGLDLTGVQNNGVQRPISRITLLLDDDNAVTAGDDTGMELTADCPHATQEMAEAILAQVKGLEYQMFSADDARLDPAAELGDGVTAGGLYSVISRLDDDGSGFPGLSAPGEAELEEEYPAAGPMTQAFTRKIAQTNSRITKTAEEIRLEVENQMEGLSASFSVQLDNITAQINGLDGQVSSIEQYVDNITINVTNGLTSSTIELKSGFVTIASDTIQMTGLVTFEGLSSGTTTIDGSCIKTGTIDADRLNLTGSISFYDMDEGAQIMMRGGNTAAGWTYGNSTYINGNMIAAGTVMADNLRGQNVWLDNSSGTAMGVISITGAQTSYAAIDFTSYGALRMVADYGAAYVESTRYNTNIEVYDRVYTRGPTVSRNGDTLGDSTYKWGDIYSRNATIQTSDLTEKKDVVYGLSGYDSLFDALRPISFRFVDGESGRRHMGLGAQDVEQAMMEADMSDMDFAGFIKSPGEEEGVYHYALRYGEFIPLCIDQIQRLKSRVDELERRLQA